MLLQAWQAVVLGLVEGITEYLPVSSTGHLILVASLLGLDRPDAKSALDAYSIVIQGGAILAVLGLYWPRVLRSSCAALLGREPAGLRLLVNLVLALPAVGAARLRPRGPIDAHLFRPLPVLVALAGGGVFMIALDRWRAAPRRAPRAVDRSARLAPRARDRRAAVPGALARDVALDDDDRRAACSSACARATAAEFSFLLGLPTLGAACAPGSCCATAIRSRSSGRLGRCSASRWPRSRRRSRCAGWSDS